MRLFMVDAFTASAFQGNPAAVCLLDSAAPKEWMQAVATEIGLSETAFLLGDSLRWFTPAVEVALCGHATLATAHVLYSTGGATGSLAFSTASGTLTVNRADDGLITMDFPARNVTAATTPDGLERALGVTPVSVWNSGNDLLVELDSEETVRSLRPDIAALEALEARAVIVTAPAAEAASAPAEAASIPAAEGPAGSQPIAGRAGVSSRQADFVSRFFAPKMGVPEDPVTGSAHCALAPYWSTRLGRATLVGAQLSARGGVVHTTTRGERVDLAGRATTILSGELHV